MSVKKQYNNATSVCKVTFRLPKETAKSVRSIYLAGDFNDWDRESIPMKKQKTGEFTASVNLKKGREYQFRYLIDGTNWINDREADKYVPNVFQSENSVVVV